MNKAIILILGILLIGCQNQGKESVQEKIFIELGGEKQYVEMTGASDDLPVMLFLHGGPGWPQTPHLRYFNAELTDEMILVSWDQAGCGQSYMHNPNPKNLSPESLVNDAHELTRAQTKLSLSGKCEAHFLIDDFNEFIFLGTHVQGSQI